MTEDWDRSPCGLLVLRTDGLVLAANRTFCRWTGREPADLAGRVRFSDLLTVGGRIYWETHVDPLLHVDREIEEVALELKLPDSRLPVLLTATAAAGEVVVRVALTPARERARYERELLAARAAAERAADQVKALQEVTAALSRTVGVPGVLDELRDAAVRLGAATASVWLRGPDERFVPHAGSDASAALRASVLPLLDRAAVQHSGRVTVPLRGRAALQGVLVVVPREDAGADPLDLEVLTAVGQQAGLALDRAQLYEQSASVAHELQRSLLTGEHPADDRFEVATEYRPGVDTLEVGGDWYDVFVAAEGVVAVVVGDVVGRGLGAASAMGQLRSAVRAVAGPGAGPAVLLSRLDRFVEHVEAASLATVAYAELDLDGGGVRYACAGQPPPVLVRAGGGVELLWGGRSAPLGAYLVAGARAEADVQLRPFDRLVLYTDGLVERRDRDLDEGFEALARAADEGRALPLQKCVLAVTEGLLRDVQTRDDVCVLLLSWSGGQFSRRIAPDLSELSAVRHELAAWLAARGVAGPTTEDLVLATSEALANAAEHGSGPDEQVELSVWFEQPPVGAVEVVVRVQDQGRWRVSDAGSERGRGLTIMRALADDVAVEAGNGTTVWLRRRTAGGAVALQAPEAR